MGQILHGSATTTERHNDRAVRRAIQHSQESLRALARRHGVNPKTIAKWKGRTSVADLPTGPKEPRSTVLTVEEEAVVVAFRRHTLLPLDDCLYALQPTIPHLTRSSLHRVSNGTGSRGCRRSKAKPPPSENSRLTRSAIFISTLLKSEQRKANSTSLSQSTEPRSSPSSNCMRRWRAARRAISCAT